MCVISSCALSLSAIFNFYFSYQHPQKVFTTIATYSSEKIYSNSRFNPVKGASYYHHVASSTWFLFPNIYKGSKPTRQHTIMSAKLQTSAEKAVPVVAYDSEDDPAPLDFRLDEGLTVLYHDRFPSSTDNDKGYAQHYSDTRAIAILRDFIQGRILPSAAGDAILDLLPDHEDYIKGGAIGKAARGEHWGLAGFLVDMATQIPYNHPAQAKLVQLIEKICESDKVGEMEQLAILLYETFQGKFSFPLAMHGTLKYSSSLFPSYQIAIGELDDTEGQLPGDHFAQALNILGFFARLGVTGLSIVHASHGVQTLRNSLEMKSYENENARYPDLRVCMAAVWVILAGQTLYAQVVEAPPSDAQTPAYYDTKELYNGPRFGLERWTFWKEGFKDAAYKRDKLSGQSKGLARVAAGLMELIEESRVCN